MVEPGRTHNNITHSNSTWRSVTALTAPSSSALYCAAVSQVWLSEGFATYIEYQGASVSLPGSYLEDFFLLTAYYLAEFFDSMPYARPVVDESIAGINNLVRAISTHTQHSAIAHPSTVADHSCRRYAPACPLCVVSQSAYYKGASLVRMLKGVLGADVFLAGVQLYLKTYQYSTAQGDDLFACLTTAAANAGQSIDVVSFMTEWIYKPG